MLILFPNACKLTTLTTLIRQGWIRNLGFDQIRALLGFSKAVATYPSLEEDPEIELERAEFEQKITKD